MRFFSKYLKIEYESEVLFFRNVIEGKLNIVVNLYIEKNIVEFSSGVFVIVNNQFILDSNIKYFYKLNIFELDFFSQVDLYNEIKTLLEVGYIVWIFFGIGLWKWVCFKFLDEGIYEL